MYKGSRQEQNNLIAECKKKTHFQEEEIHQLLHKYNEICKKDNKDRISRSAFRDFLHNSLNMTDDVLLDRIFKVFDKDADGAISQREWIEGLSVFLWGKLLECTKFAFEVYDLNGDGYISREEMFQLLKKTIYKQPNEEDADENIKELVEITLKMLDNDHDGRVSKEDYETTILGENLLLECCGPCLPSPQGRDCFLSTLNIDVHHHK